MNLGLSMNTTLVSAFHAFPFRIFPVIIQAKVILNHSEMSSIYGQIVIGAPGSGKSTYCAGLEQIFRAIKRPFALVNLDPANEGMPFKPHVDIRELITVEDTMERLDLGPNGALLYCMQTLAANLDWLKEKLEQFRGFYLVIDMPGQLELYCSDDSVRQIISQFNKWHWNVCAVCLTDSTYVNDPGKFIAVALSSLCAMINLEVAQVNVLSKVDLLPEDAPFRLEFFEELPNLKQLADLLDDHPALDKYKKLNQELCEVIESYGLVGFIALDVNDKERMGQLLRAADSANGFSLATEDDLRNLVMK